jgi:hypothetical protein
LFVWFGSLEWLNCLRLVGLNGLFGFVGLVSGLGGLDSFICSDSLVDLVSVDGRDSMVGWLC